MNIETTITTLLKDGFILVFNQNQLDLVKTAEALMTAGINNMEVTCRIDKPLEKLERSVGFLRGATGFVPSFVIMDGTPRFGKTEAWEMEGVQRLAREWEAEVWTSSHTHREGQRFDARGVPVEIARFDDFLSLIVSLEPTADHIRVRILKDRDRKELAELHLELDPRTLLIRWR